MRYAVWRCREPRGLKNPTKTRRAGSPMPRGLSRYSGSEDWEMVNIKILRMPSTPVKLGLVAFGLDLFQRFAGSVGHAEESPRRRK